MGFDDADRHFFGLRKFGKYDYNYSHSVLIEQSNVRTVGRNIRNIHGEQDRLHVICDCPNGRNKECFPPTWKDEDKNMWQAPAWTYMPPMSRPRIKSPQLCTASQPSKSYKRLPQMYLPLVDGLQSDLHRGHATVPCASC
jgi:hypothetical protein